MRNGPNVVGLEDPTHLGHGHELDGPADPDPGVVDEHVDGPRRRHRRRHRGVVGDVEGEMRVGVEVGERLGATGRGHHLVAAFLELHGGRPPESGGASRDQRPSHVLPPAHPTEPVPAGGPEDRAVGRGWSGGRRTPCEAPADRKPTSTTRARRRARRGPRGATPWSWPTPTLAGRRSSSGIGPPSPGALGRPGPTDRPRGVDLGAGAGRQADRRHPGHRGRSRRRPAFAPALLDARVRAARARAAPPHVPDPRARRARARVGGGLRRRTTPRVVPGLAARRRRGPRPLRGDQAAPSPIGVGATSTTTPRPSRP